MKRLTYAVLLFVLLLTACSLAATQESSGAARLTATATRPASATTMAPSPVRSATATLAPPTPTMIPITDTRTFTPAPTATFFIDEANCPNRREPNEDGSTDEIFTYDGGNLFYQSYSPSIGFSSIRELEPVNPDALTIKRSVSFAFSHFSDQMAYLAINSDNLAELWIADVNFCQANRYWVDSDRLFGKYPSVKIVWGPDDKTVILANTNPGETDLIVYSFMTNELYQWNGTCDRLFYSEKTDHWSLGCALEDGQFGLIDSDGDILITDELPDGLIEDVIEWAISPDGKRTLFATKDYQILVVDEAGAATKLPILWDELMLSYFHLLTYKSGLKWSHDGTRMLVYGYDPSGRRCPRNVHAETGEPIETPCWMVLDAGTNEITWWLNKKIYAQLDIPWQPAIGEYVVAEYDAAFSPDDDEIVTFLIDSPIRYFIIVSIETDRVEVVTNYAADNVHWTGH